MCRKVITVLAISCLFVVLCSSASFAGITPSPFKGKIDNIIQQLQPLTAVGADVPEDVRIKVQDIINILLSFERFPSGDTRGALLKNTIDIISRITDVLFAPFTESPMPAYDWDTTRIALDTIGNIFMIGMETSPEMRHLAKDTINLLDGITLVLFNLGSEPLGMDDFMTSLNIANNISFIFQNTPPEGRMRTLQLIGMLDNIVRVVGTHGPLPDPPTFFAFLAAYDLLQKFCPSCYTSE